MVARREKNSVSSNVRAMHPSIANDDEGNYDNFEWSEGGDESSTIFQSLRWCSDCNWDCLRDVWDSASLCELWKRYEFFRI